MNQTISPEISELTGAAHYRPAVSIIMPFEPKMNVKAEMADRLKFATDKVEKELRQNYTDDLAELVIHKLKNIVKNLNFNTFKKSIAIYVSPVFEKVLYLDIPVEEKIIIDESFEIRDLVFAKKEIHKYLVLVLSGNSSKVLLGDSSSFIKIKSNVPDNIDAFLNDAPGRVANFSDPSEKKEIILKKFLHQTDIGLNLLLHSYPFPIFIMGTKKVLGYFKELTKNEKRIAGYVHGNYEESTDTELHEALKPYINDWKKIKMTDILHQLEKAADAKKIAIGIESVWKQASQNRGRLLVVEKDFTYTAEHGGDKGTIYKATESYNKFSYIKDAVDDVVERVLENGGDIEFVDDGMLSEYQHIALIQYY